MVVTRYMAYMGDPGKSSVHGAKLHDFFLDKLKGIALGHTGTLCLLNTDVTIATGIGSLSIT